MIAQAPPVPVPTALAVSATVVARWSAGDLTGWVAVNGTASRGARLAARVRDAGGRLVASATLTASPDGALSTRIPLPRRLAPGQLRLVVGETSPPAGAEPLPERRLRVRLAPPPEGLATRTTLTRRPGELVLVVRMLVLPRRGMPLALRVRSPGGMRTGATTMRRGRTVVARIPVARAPAGRWSVTLTAGDRPVVRVTRRFRRAS